MPNDDVKEFLKTGKRLNEWTVEEVDVTAITPEVDEKNKRVSFRTSIEKASQKVFYSNSTPRMVICGKHFYMPLDPHKYIFKCKKCDYHYKANTLTHKYNPDTGEILFRKTLQPIA